VFEPPAVQLLSGDRLHLSHGPIDVVLKAWGAGDAAAAARDAACRRFPAVLPELCDELAVLRRPVEQSSAVDGPVARRMVEACRPFAGVFITPMAAVAGAVADELLACMTAAAPLARAFVNDGGDIALHVAEGEAMSVGIAADFSRGPAPAVSGGLRIDRASGVRGIATSGARGRSFSLGIADAATVLAHSAAAADAAATLIANAVNVDSPAVERRPARDLDPDSDLGALPVTVGVGALDAAEVELALARGLACAREFRRRGLLVDAALALAGETRILGRRRARPELARRAQAR